VARAELVDRREVLVNGGGVAHARPVVRAVDEPPLTQRSIVQHEGLELAQRLAVEQRVAQRSVRRDLLHERDRRERGVRRRQRTHESDDIRGGGRRRRRQLGRDRGRCGPHGAIRRSHVDARFHDANGDEPLITSSVTGGAQAQETADDEPPLVARQAFVRTGRRAGGIIEIVEGLEAGQQVVTAGQNKLSNGARVIIDNTVDPSRREGGDT
jgi:hypothetical protein